MTKRIIERFFLFRFDPTQKEMGDLLTDVDALLEQLSDRVKEHLLPGTVIEKLKAEYDKQRSEIESNVDGVVGTTDGTPWDKVSSERKTKLFWEISAIQKALLGLRSPDLRIGSTMLAVLVFLLFGSVIAYVQLHPDKAQLKTDVIIKIENVRALFSETETQLERALAEQAVAEDPNKNNDRDEQWSKASQARDGLQKALLEVLSLFSAGEQLGMLNANITNRDAAKALATLSSLQGGFEDAVQLKVQDISLKVVKIHALVAKLSANIKKVKAAAKDEASTEDKNIWENLDNLENIYETLRSKLIELPVTASTEKKLGKLGSYIKEQDRDAARDTLRSLEKSIDADIANLRESYFFTTNPKKWFEIAAWSWFGVLVGVVFYLAKQLKLGTFDRQDLPSIFGEIAMAPIVTCVVFFLFSMTGITEFSPSEESMVVTLGFAFLFGYAVRRTVGLLENIKQRVLPTP